MEKGPRPRRGGARSRRGGAHQQQKTLLTKDSQLRALLLHMLKLICRLSQQTRALMGATCDTWLVPSECILVTAIKAELANFTAAVADQRILTTAAIQGS